MVACLRRYDPTFTLDDHSTAAQVIRLFDREPPRVILIEGSMAGLFNASAPFRDRLSRRHDPFLDEPSGSVFAVRVAEPPGAQPAGGDGTAPEDHAR